MIKILLISLIYFNPICWSKLPNTLLSQDGFAVLERISGNKRILKRVKNGEVISVAKVSDKKNKKIEIQTLAVYGAGYHSKSCQFALRKLSLYENYKDYIGIIKKSTYNDDNQRIKLLLESNLLPFSMRMNFKIARIKTVGRYPFTFDNGFLKELKGDIHVYQKDKRCLLLITANYEGPSTTINNTVLEFFSKAVIELSLRNLIRISTI
jgi:hypothetical protein